MIVPECVYAEFTVDAGCNAILFYRITGDLPEMKVFTDNREFNGSDLFTIRALKRIGVMEAQ